MAHGNYTLPCMAHATAQEIAKQHNHTYTIAGGVAVPIAASLVEKHHNEQFYLIEITLLLPLFNENDTCSH